MIILTHFVHRLFADLTSEQLIVTNSVVVYEYVVCC